MTTVDPADIDLRIDDGTNETNGIKKQRFGNMFRKSAINPTSGTKNENNPFFKNFVNILKNKEQAIDGAHKPNKPSMLSSFRLRSVGAPKNTNEKFVDVVNILKNKEQEIDKAKKPQESIFAKLNGFFSTSHPPVSAVSAVSVDGHVVDPPQSNKSSRDMENMIYMVIVGILLSYIVVVTLRKYNDILYTIEYARRMQATCGSHAMEKETARSILSDKLASVEFNDPYFNNSLLVAGGAIVAYCIGFAVVYKVYSKDPEFWINNNIIVFHIIVFAILIICGAIWSVFKILPNTVDEYKTHRSNVGTNLFGKIPATVGSTDKSMSTVMSKIRDSIIKRMAHTDNLGSYDDAVNAYTAKEIDKICQRKIFQ